MSWLRGSTGAEAPATPAKDPVRAMAPMSEPVMARTIFFCDESCIEHLLDRRVV
jgi:hypothetical protein